MPFPALFAFSGSGLNQLFWLLVFLAGAASYYYLAKRKRVLIDNPPDPWADPDAVDNAMVMGVDQNSSIQLEATGKTKKLAPLAGLCVNLDSRILTIQLLKPLAPDLADEWRGREVTAYFHTASGPKMHFYRFSSIILKYEGDDACPVLEIARPLRLDPFQRRLFSRISPTRSSVLALGLWPAPPVAEFSSVWLPEDGPSEKEDNQASLTPGEDESHSALSGHASSIPEDWPHAVFPLPSHPSDLPAPRASYLPPRVETAHLANISASGLGIRVHKSRTASIPQSCVVFLSLLAKNGKTLNLWLACRRRHMTAQSGRSSAVVGLQLVEWSRVPGADAHISWNKVNSRGEVQPLVTWIMRHESAIRRANARFVNL